MVGREGGWEGGWGELGLGAIGGNWSARNLLGRLTVHILLMPEKVVCQMGNVNFHTWNSLKAARSTTPSKLASCLPGEKKAKSRD